ncbi:MAG: hypothetical protein WCX96_02425 [Bacilli bacterium]
MKKITSLLILLSMFLMPIPKVYAAKIGGTINEVLIPTQSATKSAVLFIPVSSCKLSSSTDYCQFYVDLNGVRVSSVKVTKSTPKINNNKYYQLTFDYSRAKKYNVKKTKEDNQNVIKVTTGSISITTYGYTPKMTKIIGTCNSKANLAKEQGVVLTRKEGTKKVQEFEELINVVNGPAGYDVAAGTGIKYPMYILYTYQGSEFLNYFDYSYREDTILDMYSPYLSERVKNVYRYDSTYNGFRVGYDKTGFQEIPDVVLFTELLLEQLEGKGIVSDVEKGTAGSGYVEIPGSCVTKYKWMNKETVYYNALDDCVEGKTVESGEVSASGVKTCKVNCYCSVKRANGTEYTAWSVTGEIGNECQCKNTVPSGESKSLQKLCADLDSSLKADRQACYNQASNYCNSYNNMWNSYCQPNCSAANKGCPCKFPVSAIESEFNKLKKSCEAAKAKCSKMPTGAYMLEMKTQHTNCTAPGLPIEWSRTKSEVEPISGCSMGFKDVKGACKVVRKSYTQYEYYNGITWVPGDSNAAEWTVDDMSTATDRANIDKIGEVEFCSYYKADKIKVTDQITGLITYELPLAYIERGTGYVYNDDNKTNASNPFIEESGERKLYTDLRADNNANYILRVIGKNIGFNKYSYDLTCSFNLIANGLFTGDKGTGLIIYRPIDPKDPFPRYAPLANWLGKEYLITRTGYGVYTLVPEYEVILTSLDIGSIRSYNALNEYLDYKLNKNEESQFIHKSFINLFRINK